MRLSILAAIAASALLVCGACAAGACAARVIVLAPDGHARIAQDPFISGPAITPAPDRVRTGVFGRAAAAAGSAAGSAPGSADRTMVSELARLQSTGGISESAYEQYIGAWTGALATVKRLSGTRAAELEAVIENLHGIAAAGELEPSRLPALFLTLARNVQWWTSGPLLGYGQRVEFTGSQLVWEYYPGQGIELQMLASFGKANGLYTGGQADYPALSELLSELLPLAAERAGGIAWEYDFSFDGGSPPWISAMTEGTALEALSRAYEAFGDPTYLALGSSALPPLEAPPPAGVSLPSPLGMRFIQYSFAPGTEIINAFLQTLIGLYDFAHVSGNTTAAQLFAAGNAQALADVPLFNTGAWSLYQPGIEDDLSYHELVTGFLQQLCARTSAPVYCSTASDFQADLSTPPALAQLTASARAGAPITLRFRLSKESRVGIVLTLGSQTVFLTSADFGYGVDTFTIPALKTAGEYSVRLAATDLAGNFNRIVGALSVKAPPARKTPPRHAK